MAPRIDRDTIVQIPAGRGAIGIPSEEPLTPTDAAKALKGSESWLALRLREFPMRRDKPSSKQSSQTTWYERPIAYNREIFMAICRRLLQGEDLKTICAK